MSGLYTGEKLGEAAYGEGVLRTENGGLYKGFWKDNQPHGYLHYTSQDGNVFVYEVRDGQADGKNTIWL